ncbi:UNVERIFIED_CONTAM: protein LURP-one-related 7 [Sesamum radiatum]|uniref:Protein LURP-one-related 7 n=1 Tax=Sesamum radiatum TaxID=300843 RepID=A0AAW2W3A1_SESRA
MEESSTVPFDEFKYPANFPIPFDLFVSKKYKGLGSPGNLRFTDSAGNLVYMVRKLSHKSADNRQDCTKKLLLDSSGNTLFTINRVSVSSLSDYHVVFVGFGFLGFADFGVLECIRGKNVVGGWGLVHSWFNGFCVRIQGSWQGFRANDEEKNLVFIVDKTLDELTRTEFKILLLGENNGDSKTELQMKGCPFKRACTIYKDDSIVAETSLMYKLGIGKVFVPRNRFRVTIFPGFDDHCLVASLIVIYFDGRRLWI